MNKPNKEQAKAIQWAVVAATAIGGGGLGSLVVNWRGQNVESSATRLELAEARIVDLEGQVDDLRTELTNQGHEANQRYRDLWAEAQEVRQWNARLELFIIANGLELPESPALNMGNPLPATPQPLAWRYEYATKPRYWFWVHGVDAVPAGGV